MLSYLGTIWCRAWADLLWLRAAQALALGADAVMVGRPVLWGLTVGGQEGVYKVTRSIMPPAHEDVLPSTRSFSPSEAGDNVFVLTPCIRRVMHGCLPKLMQSLVSQTTVSQYTRAAIRPNVDSTDMTGLGAAEGGAGAFHGPERLLPTQPDNEGPAHRSGWLRSIVQTVRKVASAKTRLGSDAAGAGWSILCYRPPAHHAC